MFPTPGRSPDATSPACDVGLVVCAKESDSTPTVTPVPSTPKWLRAVAAFKIESPSETIEPLGHVAEVIGVRICETYWTPATPPTLTRSTGRTAAVIVRFAALTNVTCAPAADSADTVAALVEATRMSTRSCPEPARSRLPGPETGVPAAAACALAEPAATDGWATRSRVVDRCARVALPLANHGGVGAAVGAACAPLATAIVPDATSAPTVTIRAKARARAAITVPSPGMSLACTVRVNPAGR